MLQRQCTCGTETFHMYRDGSDVVFMCTGCGKIVMCCSFYVDNNCEFVRS
jgi:hypothetical protein